MQKRWLWGIAAGVLVLGALVWAQLSPDSTPAPSPPREPEASGGQVETRPVPEVAPAPKQVRPLVGYMAPNFTLSDLNGKRVSLADFRGKVVFVNFWATWCGPCRQEMPDMQKLFEQQNPDVVILAVNLTNTERSPELVRRFMEELQLGFTALLDPEGAVAEQYRLLSIPMSVFVGPDGVIRAKHLGPMTLEMMEKYVAQAREGSGAAEAPGP